MTVYGEDSNGNPVLYKNEAEREKHWAQQNFKGGIINPMWHPARIRECQKIQKQLDNHETITIDGHFGPLASDYRTIIDQVKFAGPKSTIEVFLIQLSDTIKHVINVINVSPGKRKLLRHFPFSSLTQAKKGYDSYVKNMEKAVTKR